MGRRKKELTILLILLTVIFSLVSFGCSGKPDIPKQYQSSVESPLVLSVEAGTNEFDVKLEQGR